MLAIAKFVVFCYHVMDNKVIYINGKTDNMDYCKEDDDIDNNRCMLIHQSINQSINQSIKILRAWPK